MWGVPNRDGTMALTLQGIHGSTAADVSSEMQAAFPEVCICSSTQICYSSSSSQRHINQHLLGCSCQSFSPRTAKQVHA
jgi:hypothetical protein